MTLNTFKSPTNNELIKYNYESFCLLKLFTLIDRYRHIGIDVKWHLKVSETFRCTQLFSNMQNWKNICKIPDMYLKHLDYYMMNEFDWKISMQFDKTQTSLTKLS